MTTTEEYCVSYNKDFSDQIESSMAEGGKDFDVNMDIEKDETTEAAEGISVKEIEMIKTLRALGFEPKHGSIEDVIRISKIFQGVKDESARENVEEHRHVGQGRHHYPKFSIFFGEEGKGEVNWETFRYEVEAVRQEDIFTSEQIMFGMRRSLKGKAGDKVRRLGPGVTVRHVLEKLESAYGTVETKESVMKKFYTCEQKPNESVESFASRLEDLFDQGVELQGFHRSDTVILKQVLHSGLRKELKHMSVYQCDKIQGYDEFKRELRKLEADMNADGQESKKPCKPTVQMEKKEDTDNSEVKQLLKQINERIDKLEMTQSEKSAVHQPQQQPKPWSGQRRWRGGIRGRHVNRGRGRGQQSYNNSQQPSADNTFAPLCYLCNKKGHIQRNCPTILAQLVCTKCKTKGHTSKDCPKE